MHTIEQRIGALSIASAMLTEAAGEIAALRAALTEALDAWQGWASWAEPRIAELRKLTGAPDGKS